jgi:hypothetical protein
MRALIDPGVVLSMLMLSLIDPAIVLSMLMLSLIDPAHMTLEIQGQKNGRC